MATAMARSVLRTAVRGGPLARTPASKRSFASSAHDDAHETAKWEKITYAGIVTCSVLAFYILSKGHAHYEEPLPYPHLHIRNKEFPWGPQIDLCAVLAWCEIDLGLQTAVFSTDLKLRQLDTQFSLVQMAFLRISIIIDLRRPRL
ncbi:unnamed protein product [Camellia sinensis]